MRECAIAPGQSVPCAVTVADDLFLARLAAELSGAMRVDFSLCDPQGAERQRMTDVLVRGEAGSVIRQESITFAKASPRAR